MRALARGIETRGGEPLEADGIIAVLDRIDADPELSARLDALDERALHAEFLVLYEGEMERDG